MKVVVHVDGGARGNPGPAAAAAVISSPEGDVLAEAAERIGTATNNVAEYRGLLLGLARAKALGATEVEVINDSELIAKQVTGEYRVKHADLKPLRAEALEALRDFATWSIRSVPRAQNAAADALVNQALDADPDGADAEPLPEPAVPAAPPAGRSGGTDYATYLLIDDLLALQRPLTPDAHDELLFIVVHQSYELWFKLILHELTRARDALLAGRAHAAVPALSRTVAIERLLLDHLDVLETMGPDGFLEFRDPLAPASGFQSVQFRRIEWISGLRDLFPGDAEPPPGPSLYEAFCTCAGLPEDPERRMAALAALYRDHDDPGRAWLYCVAERLVDHDEGIALWRQHHVLMAAREIGTRRGTGGSPGVPYLKTTLDRRFFPELWAVRVRL